MKSFDGVDSLEDTVGLHYWLPDEAGRFFFRLGLPLYDLFRDLWRVVRAEMPQLRFLLSGSGTRIFRRPDRAGSRCEAGRPDDERHPRYTLRGAARVIGVPVLPLGWLALGCGAANYWVDRLYDGAPLRDRLSRRSMRRCARRSISALRWPGCRLFLAGRLQPVSPAMRRLVSQIDHWL